MKTILIGILLSPLFAQAVTKGFFPFTGMQGMVTIATTGSLNDGNDPDPVKLFMEMLVEPQDSFLGRGKTIKTNDGILTIVCGERGGGNYQCSIVVKKGAGANIRPSQKFFEYRLTGPETAEIFEKFKHIKDEYIFQNGDQRFKILSRPDLLHVTFQDY